MSVQVKVGWCDGLNRPEGVKPKDWQARREAVFSDTYLYRYSLTITEPAGAGQLVVVMLNPSRADEMLDDPTVRRCRGFAVGWGYRHLQILNLFAYRATAVKDMKKAEDPVGSLNDHWLAAAALQPYFKMLVAWGAHGAHRGRAAHVRQVLGARELWCLGTNAGGSPKHPLYLSASTELTKWGTA